MDSSNSTYIVAGTKPWNQRVFDEVISHFPGKWVYVREKEQLTVDFVKQIKPNYIFFLHWSWLVPEEIINNYECVCFHMADVPYGRGGSPLQNLILRGHQQTKLSALRMTHEFDAGPVYLKENLGLAGSAEEIYIRATYLSAEMIGRIIRGEILPVPQSGEVVIFKRRTHAQSSITEISSLQNLHDFIRMLDAEGYPKAFLNYQGFRYEFSRAVLYDGRIVADVTITQLEDKSL
ncbi:MAG: methionyl-tRNA formyltransferase [Anaerolineales bacterium]|nr:methionyl-tRNA formyltransferase [Anaerolineales bacterium]